MHFFLFTAVATSDLVSLWRYSQDVSRSTFKILTVKRDMSISVDEDFAQFVLKFSRFEIYLAVYGISVS